MRAVLVACAAALFAPAAAGAAPVRIALTIDDLPVHGPLPPGETRVDIARRIIAALQAAHVPPTYGFINAGTIEQEPDSAPVLDLWRQAGFPLGNHTWSHADLNNVGPAAFAQETMRNEDPLMAGMAGEDWHWFRFPYLHEGRDPATRAGVRQMLAERGYRIAAVTMSFGDYRWNAPYARLVAAQDAAGIAALERRYLLAADEALTRDRAAAKLRYRRDIPFVLLMHIGAFDARMMPRLLALYRHRGVRFVSLAEAERDPAYAADVQPALPPAPHAAIPEVIGPDDAPPPATPSAPRK